MKKATVAAIAVLGMLTARQAAASPEKMSEQGTFVIRTDTSLIGTIGASAANVGSFTVFDVGTMIALAPAVDYFVIKNLSVGGAMPFQLGIANGNKSIVWGLLPRVGYNLGFGEKFSLWPQFSMGVVYVNPGGGGSAKALMRMYAPFLFHPADHFFVGLGPDFQSSFESMTYGFGFGWTIGGHF